MQAMNPRLSARGVICWGALLLSALGFSPGVLANPPAPPFIRPPDATPLRTRAAFDLHPLAFVANQGQMDPGVGFSARGKAFSLGLGREGLTLATAVPAQNLHQDQLQKPGQVRLIPLGMNPGVEPVGWQPQGVFHYYLGNDPRRWRERVPAYRGVLYREIYPGIDLKFYGAGAQLEYDLIVKPGADLSRVRFQCRGIRELTVNPAGDLVLRLPDGQEILQQKPRIYQEVDGRPVAREGRFRLGGKTGPPTYGFEVAAYDPNLPLVIDPVVIFSSYLGGSQSDVARAVALGRGGRLCVIGETDSDDFPSKPAAVAPGGTNVLVARFLPDGSLDFATLLGGSGHDAGYGLGVDWFDGICLAGTTTSDDFPVYLALQSAKSGGSDAFVARLYSDGTLDFASYLGGDGEDGVTGLALDSLGNFFVTGRTASTNFPTLNPLPGGGTLHGNTDAFVAKIEPPYLFIDPLHYIYIWFPASLAYSTYLGGSGEDGGQGIALDQTSNIYVTGSTSSADFPLAHQLSGMHGGSDAFATMVKFDGSLYFSTLVGGSADETGYAIAVDQEGCLYVTGMTESSDFPTSLNALQKSVPNSRNAFLVKLKPPASGPKDPVTGEPSWLPAATVYSTYLGGTELLAGEVHCEGRGLAVDQSGNAWVAGFTNVPSFPTRHPLQAFGGSPTSAVAGNPAAAVSPDDAFVSILSYDPVFDQMSLAFSTFWGGSGDDRAFGMTLDKKSNIHLVGETSSKDFPIHHAAQSALAGDRDAFVTRIAATEPASLAFLLLLLD